LIFKRGWLVSIPFTTSASGWRQAPLARLFSKGKGPLIVATTLFPEIPSRLKRLLIGSEYSLTLSFSSDTGMNLQ
jgi:hypothetical protein